VLAVIVGIGTMLFNEFTKGFGGNQPTLDDALSMVLASLSLLGLGIFGPGIATGLTAGAPQLGAGAAVGTVIVKETTKTGAIVAHDLKLCPIVMDVLAKMPAERRVGPLISDGEAARPYAKDAYARVFNWCSEIFGALTRAVFRLDSEQPVAKLPRHSRRSELDLEAVQP
jgi:hypothetical protein